MQPISQGFLQKKKLVFILLLIGSLILFGFKNLPGLALAFIFICGDAACTSLGIASIIQVWITGIISFTLPGIFIYSLIYKNWRLPLYFLGTLFASFLCSFILSLSMGQNSLSSLGTFINREGALNTLLSGTFGNILMFILYAVPFFFILRSQNGNTPSKGELILKIELIAFTAVIAIATFAPQAFQQIEGIVRFRKSQIPFGTVYYKMPRSNLGIERTVIHAIDAKGNKQTIEPPSDCQKPIISWDQRKIFCYGSNVGYLMDTVTKETRTVALPNLYISNAYAWSKDGKYIALTTKYDSITSLLQVLNIETMQIEILTQTPFAGYIATSVFSPNGNYIAFKLSEEGIMSKEEVKLYDFNTKKIIDLPDNPICHRVVGCSIHTLQFSRDTRYLFYSTEESLYNPTSGQLDTMVLVDLKDLSSKKTSKTSQYGIFDLSFYDGAESFFYPPSLLIRDGAKASKKPDQLAKIYIPTGKESVVKLHEGAVLGHESILTPDAQWVVYRKLEGGSYVTYMEKFDTQERYAIFTNNESVEEVRDQLLPH